VPATALNARIGEWSLLQNLDPVWLHVHARHVCESLTYDAKGNMTSGNGLTVSYASQQAIIDRALYKHHRVQSRSRAQPLQAGRPGRHHTLSGQ